MKRNLASAVIGGILFLAAAAEMVCAGTDNHSNTRSGVQAEENETVTETEPCESVMGESAMLFDGSKTGSGKNSYITTIFTEHVGGKWNASLINEGSWLYAEYEGDEDGVDLALSSVSGATEWAAVYADETGTTENGREYAIYSYDNFADVFGTEFSHLDLIQVYGAGDGSVTLKRVAYFEGEGDPVDDGDGIWDCPSEGIAFLGDSIVHNPKIEGAHLKKKDWNGILDRDDCVNYGIGSQTTRECAARIEEIAGKDYSAVVILCGINDLGSGRMNWDITGNFETMFLALKEENPDIQIFVISILPTTDDYFKGTQYLITNLNAQLKFLANKHENVTYVDCHSSVVGEDGYAMPELMIDGLHPNLDGYAVIAEVLNPYLDEVMEDKTEEE